MQRPRILLAVTKNVGAERRESEKRYEAAIASAGGEPVFMLPSDAEIPQHDGLLIMGGPDIHPRLYGEELDGCEELLPPESEAALVRVYEQAHQGQSPVLGICMGMQFINVMHGGCLRQDMGAQSHRLSPEEDGETEVEIFEGSRLHALAGSRNVRVNCHHHQCVERIGDGLVASAQAEDGTVEGIERTDDWFVVGVQWHPERTPSEASDKIFQSFVDLCATRC